MISLETRKVTLNIFSELQDLLPNHAGYFRPVVDDIYGIGMFINKRIQVVDEGNYPIYHNAAYPGRGPAHSRILQWAKCGVDNDIFTIVNVHGLWNGMGKTDTAERLAQSEKIRQFMDKVDTRKILCGDFNLKPDTHSLKMIAQGMKNLVEEFQVTSTRTSLYPKIERFADYVFISPDIKVNQFAVLKDEVSDHAPLLLDFE